MKRKKTNINRSLFSKKKKKKMGRREQNVAINAIFFNDVDASEGVSID